jgi:hypothetical protein
METKTEVAGLRPEASDSDQTIEGRARISQSRGPRGDRVNRGARAGEIVRPVADGIGKEDPISSSRPAGPGG